MKLIFSFLIFLVVVVLTFGRPELMDADEKEVLISITHPEIDPTALVIIEDRLYFIESTVKLSGKEAMQVCNELNMKLITLENESKNLAIRDYLKNQTLGLQAYWTGGQKFFGDWQWSGLGHMMDYTDWFMEQPDYTGTVTTLAAVYGDYGWFDYPYTTEHHFICE